jgi:hypothetical protein
VSVDVAGDKAAGAGDVTSDIDRHAELADGHEERDVAGAGALLNARLTEGRTLDLWPEAGPIASD